MATLRVAIDSMQARAGAQQFEQATSRIRGSTDRTARGVNTLDQRMHRFGGTLRNIGTRLLATFGAVTGAAGLGGLGRVIGGFEETMATVGAVAGATQGELEELTALAREMGATTRFSAQEAGEGLLFLSRAGFETFESVAALPETLNLAAAGAIDLGTSADLASNLLAQFGLAADETRRVTDALITVSNRANTDILQLGEAMKFVGPIAGSLGISIEQAAAAVGVLGDAGIQGSMAGTSLRMALQRLVSPAGAARRELAALGIELSEIDPTVNTLAQVFARFREANIDAAQATTIFGLRSAAAGLVLTRYADRIAELTELTENSEGAAAEMAETIANTLPGQFKALISVVQEMILQLGDRGLTGGIRAVVVTMTDAFRIFAGMQDRLVGSEVAARRTAAAFVFLATLAATVTTALIAQRAAWALLTIAMMRNPIGLIAVAVAGAVTALWSFRDAMIAIGDTTLRLGDLVGGVWDVVVDRFRFALNGLVMAATDTVDVIMSLFDTLVGFIQAILGTQVGQLVTRVWGRALELMVDMLRGTVNTIIGLFSGMARTIAQILSAVVDSARAVADFDISRPLNSSQNIASRLAILGVARGVGIASTFAEELERDFIGEIENRFGRGRGIIDALRQSISGQLGFMAAIGFPIMPEDILRDVLQRAEQRASLRVQAIEGSDESRRVRERVERIGELIDGMDDLAAAELGRHHGLLRMIEDVDLEISLMGQSEDARERASRMAEFMRAAEESLGDQFSENHDLVILYANALDLLERARGLERMREFNRELELERSLIGLTNDERERAIRLREFETAAMLAAGVERRRQALFDAQQRAVALRDGGLTPTAPGFPGVPVDVLSHALELSAAKDLALAMDEVGAATAAYLDQLRELDQMRRLADFAENFGNRIAQSFEQAVLSAERFRDVLSALYEDLIRLAFSQFVTQPLGQLFTGGLNNLFGLGQAPAPAIAGSSGLVFKGRAIEPMQSGGVLYTRPTFLERRPFVAEQGPELLMNLEQVRNLANARGGDDVRPISIVMHIQTPDADSFRRSQAQIASRMEHRMQLARRGV